MYRWSHFPLLFLPQLPVWGWSVRTPGELSDPGSRDYKCTSLIPSVFLNILYNKMFNLLTFAPISGLSCNRLGQHSCLRCKVSIFISLICLFVYCLNKLWANCCFCRHVSVTITLEAKCSSRRKARLLRAQSVDMKLRRPKISACPVSSLCYLLLQSCLIWILWYLNWDILFSIMQPGLHN